jgi:hypothetical protein
MKQPIHFHSSDTRFCGDDAAGRRFTMDSNAVTCQPCKDRDRLWLTPDAKRYVASLKSTHGELSA